MKNNVIQGTCCFKVGTKTYVLGDKETKEVVTINLSLLPLIVEAYEAGANDWAVVQEFNDNFVNSYEKRIKLNFYDFDRGIGKIDVEFIQSIKGEKLNDKLSNVDKSGIFKLDEKQTNHLLNHILIEAEQFNEFNDDLMNLFKKEAKGLKFAK